MEIKPKISLVISARNDDYGGNFLNRISAFLRTLIYFTNENKTLFELVIVEYNPPSDKLSLSEVLPIKNNTYLSVRFITVPREFHDQLAQGSKNPFFEYVAKNIGIRRAKGDYILATNPDLVFSNELLGFLANDALSIENFYRINRHDVRLHVFDNDVSVPDILRWCRKNVIRVMTNNGTLFYKSRRWLKRFLLRPTLRHLLRFPIFNFTTRLKIKLNPNRLHESAAGDFMMAHSKAWNEVGGYDQIPFNSFVDGYNVHVFPCYGFKQQIIPYPVYHIAHDSSNASRKQPDFKTFRNTVKKMDKTKIPYKKYDSNWGFPDIKFEEKIIKA